MNASSKTVAREFYRHKKDGDLGRNIGRDPGDHPHEKPTRLASSALYGAKRSSYAAASAFIASRERLYRARSSSLMMLYVLGARRRPAFAALAEQRPLWLAARTRSSPAYKPAHSFLFFSFLWHGCEQVAAHGQAGETADQPEEGGRVHLHQILVPEEEELAPLEVAQSVQHAHTVQRRVRVVERAARGPAAGEVRGQLLATLREGLKRSKRGEGHSAGSSSGGEQR